MSTDELPSFSDMGLAAPIVQAILDIGYETPSPIQAASIPLLLEGRDIIGQAQTGTGKTAAFALPLMTRIDVTKKNTQLLVLAPTRELAIQVAEAFQTYARNMPNFHVLPIYGGQAYDGQLRQLRRGAQVVVGTPGRVMDHIRKGTLKLDSLQALVLDEADEMLRMGFIDDVEWVLEHTPPTRQIALFSATMPSVIRRVATKYLTNPAEIKIESKTTTAPTISQKYWRVSGLHKLDALTRILEMQTFDAMLIFVRTKSATVELAEKLAARGYACDALNGDISQQLRERTVEKLKNGKLDILVATDVVARGLDVERISCVLNYDIPYDTESYVHRIGRTGRAGRSGEAILFVSAREERMLRSIENATRQKIEPMTLPTAKDINTRRVDRFKAQVSEVMAGTDLSFYADLLTEYQREHDADPLQIAAALAAIVQGDTPLLLSEKELKGPSNFSDRGDRGDRNDRGTRNDRGERGDRGSRGDSAKRGKRSDMPEGDMQRYSLSVGHEHGVKPGNIVGAIANEANIDSKYIGQIEIGENSTLIDLPAGMPKNVTEMLKNTVVCGQKLNLKVSTEEISSSRPPRRRPRRS